MYHHAPVPSEHPAQLSSATAVPPAKLEVNQLRTESIGGPRAHALRREGLERFTGAIVLPIDQIIHTVCSSLHITVESLASNSRAENIVWARALIIYFATEYTDHIYADIADAIGRPNHSTVLTALTRFRLQLKQGSSRIALESGDGTEFVPLTDLVERTNALLLKQWAPPVALRNAATASPIQKIIISVCVAVGVDPEVLASTHRSKNVSLCRALICYFAREDGHGTYPGIASATGKTRSTHSTSITAENRLYTLLANRSCEVKPVGRPPLRLSELIAKIRVELAEASREEIEG